MYLIALIIATGWIVLWLYWIITATKSKKGTPANTKQFVGSRLGLIGLALLSAAVFSRLPDSIRNHAIGNSPAVLALGLILFLLGMALSVWARLNLGQNWGMPMTKKHDPQLVTTGPYRFVRHPIYSGFLLMMLGSALAVNSYWLVPFVVASVFFIYSAVTEEKVLLEQFPKAYPAYKAKTKMLVPFVF